MLKIHIVMKSLYGLTKVLRGLQLKPSASAWILLFFYNLFLIWYLHSMHPLLQLDQLRPILPCAQTTVTALSLPSQSLLCNAFRVNSTISPMFLSLWLKNIQLLDVLIWLQSILSNIFGKSFKISLYFNWSTHLLPPEHSLHIYLLTLMSLFTVSLLIMPFTLYLSNE